MDKKLRFFSALVLWLLIFAATSLLSAEPRKTEAELIQMLSSRNYSEMNDALDRLPHWYPKNTNAIEIIRGILRSNQTMVVTQYVQLANSRNSTPGTQPLVKFLPHQVLARMAARALGNYHANVDKEDLQEIYKLLRSRDVDATMDGLKALRGLNAPQAVPEILPLLEDENPHVVRDSCRTLAVLGNKDAIPYIVPLIKNFRVDVRGDAQEAIKALQNKP